MKLLSTVETAQKLRDGDIVAIPTETVYGLAADATNFSAVEKIFALKKRPNFNPLISHVADLEMAMEYGQFCDLSIKLAHHFWAGPMTLIVEKNPQMPANIAENVSAGLNTIGLRVPNHPVMQEVIRLLGRAIAAPSANKSGFLSTTSAQQVLASFGEDAPFIAEGKGSDVGLESTILQVKDNRVILLRQGGLTSEEIEDTLKTKIIVNDGVQNSVDVIAPGQLLKHYAPKKPLFLNKNYCPPNCGFLAFGEHNIDTNYVYQLSLNKNLDEAAKKLFIGLFWLEKQSIDAIYVAPIPTNNIGKAINDRLYRAAKN